MLVRFDFETDSEEETLKTKLREAENITTLIESRLSVIVYNRMSRMGKELDRRMAEKDYF